MSRGLNGGFDSYTIGYMTIIVYDEAEKPREAEKKSSSTSGPTTKRGVRGKDRTTKKN